MPEGFVEYLKDISAKSSGKQNLFVPAEATHARHDILRVEEALGCKLPEAYWDFIETLGTGRWAHAFIKPPADLYFYDDDADAMCGFIALAENVDGNGNEIAFNPTDGQIYFCSHDPLGYARVAATFEDYLKSIAHAWMKNPKTGPVDFHESLTLIEL